MCSYVIWRESLLLEYLVCSLSNSQKPLWNKVLLAPFHRWLNWHSQGLKYMFTTASMKQIQNTHQGQPLNTVCFLLDAISCWGLGIFCKGSVNSIPVRWTNLNTCACVCVHMHTHTFAHPVTYSKPLSYTLSNLVKHPSAAFIVTSICSTRVDFPYLDVWTTYRYEYRLE